MSLVIQTIDPLAIIPNNNPGNTPDYIEHEYITLRRYAGRPINHTEGDDNLELLRKRIGDIITNINSLNQNVINIDNKVQTFEITEEFINNIIQKIYGDENFWININQNVTQYLVDDSTFNQHIDGRVVKFFEGDISQYIELQITEVMNGLPPGFMEALLNALDGRYVDLDTFNEMDAKVTQIYSTINQTIQAILAPYLVEINAFEARLAAMEALIDQLVDFVNDGDPIDLTDIITAINQLGLDIGINANNIAILDANLTTALSSIAVLNDAVGVINSALQDLTDIIGGIIAYIDGALADLLQAVKDLFTDLGNMLGSIVGQVVQNTLDIDALFSALHWLNLELAKRFEQIWDEIFLIWKAIGDLEEKVCLIEAQVDAVMDLLDLLEVKAVQVCKDGVVDTDHFLTLDNETPDYADAVVANGGVWEDGDTVMYNGKAYTVTDAVVASANPIAPTTDGVVNGGWVLDNVPEPGGWPREAGQIVVNAQNCINALGGGNRPPANMAQQNARDIAKVLNDRAAAVQAGINARNIAHEQGIENRNNNFQAGLGKL